MKMFYHKNKHGPSIVKRVAFSQYRNSQSLGEKKYYPWPFPQFHENRKYMGCPITKTMEILPCSRKDVANL